MTEINDIEPVKIVGTTRNSITLELDSTGFSDYKRQGIVENVKVPTIESFQPWQQAFKNPKSV